MALYTPEERDEVAARLIDLLAADERIARAELAGSGASGYADRWSDGGRAARSLDPDELLRATRAVTRSFFAELRRVDRDGADCRELADRLEARLLEFLDETG